MTIPKVIKLVKFVRAVYKREVPFSKKNIFIRDNYTCQYCNKEFNNINNLTIDHITPRSKGGKTSWTNCITSCKRCNNIKGSKTTQESKMFLNKLPKKPTITEFMNKRQWKFKDVLDEVYNEMLR